MPSDVDYTPPPEAEGGWRVTEPSKLNVDAEQLKQAVSYHNGHTATRSYGGALVIVHKGHVIAENYVTGEKAALSRGAETPATTSSRPQSQSSEQ